MVGIIAVLTALRSSASLVPLGPDGVAAAVADSRAAGVPEVIIDASLWPGITSPESWAGLPDLLLPALEAGGERGAAPALAVGSGAGSP